MTDELCEEDIRVAFKTGRLRFKRVGGGFVATLVDPAALDTDENVGCIEFVVREERGTSCDGTVSPAYTVAITDKRSFMPQQTTRMPISQSLYEEICSNVTRVELRREAALRKDVKALLYRKQASNNS